MDKIHLYDKILSPMVTEKTTNLSEQNKIVFRVPRAANKKNLKKNIEKIFKVNVTKINIINKQHRSKVTKSKKVTEIITKIIEIFLFVFNNSLKKIFPSIILKIGIMKYPKLASII